MSGNRLGVGAAGLALVLAVVIGFRLRVTGEVSPAVSSAWGVVVGRPQQGDFEDAGRWFGCVVSPEGVPVIAMVASRIVSVDAADGVVVAKGASLFTLDDPLIEARLDGLQDPEERAQWARALHVSAPVAGLFVRRAVSAGQMIRPGDRLAELVPSDRLVIQSTLFPDRAVDLAGLTVRIRGPGGEELPGTVARVLPERTAVGATMIWIESAALGRELHMGETASGTVVYARHRGALCLPDAAVLQDEQGRSWVMLKRADAYVRQPVTTGLVSGGRVEVLSGLDAEDEVVLSGGYALFHRDFSETYKVVD